MKVSYCFSFFYDISGNHIKNLIAFFLGLLRLVWQHESKFSKHLKSFLPLSSQFTLCGVYFNSFYFTAFQILLAWIFWRCFSSVLLFTKVSIQVPYSLLPPCLKIFYRDGIMKVMIGTMYPLYFALNGYHYHETMRMSLFLST